MLQASQKAQECAEVLPALIGGTLEILTVREAQGFEHATSWMEKQK